MAQLVNALRYLGFWNACFGEKLEVDLLGGYTPSCFRRGFKANG